MHPDQDEGSVKGVEGQMKQVFFLNNQDMMYNPSQVGHSHAMVGWALLNHYLSQKFKLIGRDEFSYLIYILLLSVDSKFSLIGKAQHAEYFNWNER